MKYNKQVLLILLFLTVGILAQSKRAVGIIPFENRGSAADNWMGRGIEEVLTNKLGSVSRLSLYEKETLRRVQKKLNVPGSEAVDARKAFSLGKATGIEVLFVGTYKVSGTDVSGTLKMVSTYTGAPIFDEPFSGPSAQISSMLEAKVRKGLGIMQIPISSADEAGFSATLTNSLPAFESYCKAYIEVDKDSPLEVVAGYFQRASKSDPQFWQAQYNLGVLYYNAKFYDRAMQQFDAILTTNPNLAKPHFGKGVISFLQKRNIAALKHFRTAVRLDGGDDRTHYYQGITYTRVDSIKRAIQSLEKAIELNPNYAPMHYHLGLADMKRGWFKRAVTSLTKATKLNPEFYLANNALGEAYYALNLFEEAIIEFNKAIKLKSNYATAYFNLGNSIYKKGALEEIVDAFWALIEVQYVDVQGEGTNGHTTTPIKGLEGLREKSRLEDNSQILRKMIHAYRTALKYDKRFYEASYNVALTYENLGQEDSAMHFFKLAISQKPELAQAHMRLGKIYESRKNYDSALAEYKLVVTYEPDYFASNPKLGEPFRYVNVIESVLHEQQKKLQANPQDKDAIEVIGRIYLSLGRLGQAEQYYAHLVQLSPNDMLAQQTLREIRRRLRKL